MFALMPHDARPRRRHTQSAAQAATSGATARRCSNLDFGRSWRWTLVQPDQAPLIGRQKQVCQLKWDDERCWRDIVKKLAGADRQTILAAMGMAAFFGQHGMSCGMAMSA